MHTQRSVVSLIVQALLTCGFLAVQPGSAHAQWVQANGPKGGLIRSLAAIPDGSGGSSLFAGQLYVWRTQDGGANWTRHRNGLTDPAAFSLLPLSNASGGNDLLVGTQIGVFRSTDNGESWSPSSSGLPGKSIYALAAGPNGSGGRNVYAGTFEGKVFRSGNDGASWTDVTSGAAFGFNVYALTVTSSGMVIAGTGGGIFRSTNFGASWTRVFTHYGFSFARHGSTIYAGTSNGVHRSTDDGATWTPINSGMNFTWVNAVAAVPTGSGVTLFAGAGYVMRSTDNGATWTIVNNGFTTIGVYALAAVPNASGGTDLYAGTSQGVFRSSNLGTSWIDVSFRYSIVQALETTPSGAILAGTENDTFRSTDGGATWVDRNAQMAPLDFAKNLVGGTALFACGSPTGVSKSTDDGVTWVSTSTNIGDFDVNSVSVVPNGSGGSNILAGTYSGVFLSRDNGDNWEFANANLMPLDCVVIPNGSGGQDVLGGGFHGVWRSTTYGATWSPVGGPLADKIVQAMAETGGGANVFAGGDVFGVYRSTDGGSTWTPANNGLADARVFALLSPDGTNLFAGGSGGVYVSTDDGSSWTSVSMGLAESVYSLALSTDGSTLLAGTTGLGVWKRPLSEMVNVAPPPPPPPAPAIASFSPSSGPVGTSVTITGSNFGGASAVTFSGAPSSYTVLSSSQILATVPSNATTGRIAVTTAGGTATSGSDFTVTAPPPPTVFTFTPPHDAYVRSSSPNANFGSAAEFRVRGGSQTQRSYLKFIVSGVTGSVQSATLRLRVVDPGPDGGSVFSVSNNLRNTTTPWTESALTWNNAPALNGSALDGAGSVAASTWIELDVTSAVTGDGTCSFAVSGGSNNVVDYSSSEGASPPQLVVVVGSGSSATRTVASGTQRMEAAPPAQLALHANTPNPFNPRTTIRYSLPRATRVRLVIYDVAGRLVRRLVDGMEEAGERAATWDGRDERGAQVGSGLYIYRLEADGERLTRKMSLLK